jgi:hypothetical protein
MSICIDHDMISGVMIGFQMPDIPANPGSRLPCGLIIAARRQRGAGALVSPPLPTWHLGPYVGHVITFSNALNSLQIRPAENKPHPHPPREDSILTHHSGCSTHIEASTHNGIYTLYTSTTHITGLNFDHLNNILLICTYTLVLKCFKQFMLLYKYVYI